MPTKTEPDYARLLAFRNALRGFLAWSDDRARAAGVTPAQHQLLLAVRGRAEPPTIGEVAADLRLRHHSAEATTGRGLQLLESVATSWGVQPAGRGKTVWFELDGESGGRGGRLPVGEDLAALLDELAGGQTAEGGGKGAVARGSAPPSLGSARFELLPGWAGAVSPAVVRLHAVALPPSSLDAPSRAPVPARAIAA